MNFATIIEYCNCSLVKFGNGAIFFRCGTLFYLIWMGLLFLEIPEKIIIYIDYSIALVLTVPSSEKIKSQQKNTSVVKKFLVYKFQLNKLPIVYALWFPSMHYH